MACRWAGVPWRKREKSTSWGGLVGVGLGVGVGEGQVRWGGGTYGDEEAVAVDSAGLRCHLRL